MPKYDSIPHLLTLFPNEAMDRFPYPSAFASVDAMSPDLAAALANQTPAFLSKIETLRDMDHMFKHAIGSAVNAPIAHYNILQHHLNTSLALIDAATTLNTKPDSPEQITNNEGYFKGAQEKMMNHLQLSYFNITQKHDPKQAEKELSGLGTGILGMQEWLSEVVAANTNKGNDFQHETAALYGGAYRFLSEMQYHMEQLQEQLAHMPPAPPPQPDEPTLKPRFDVPMPVMSLYPKLHPCVYGQSPNELPEIVRFHTEVPSPAIEEQMDELKRLDEGHIRAINQSNSLDETYYNIMRHHLVMAYRMVHLAAQRTPRGSPEWGLFESSHFNDSQDHCIAQIDQLYAASDLLRQHTNQDQRLRHAYGIRNPALASTSKEYQAFERALTEMQVGLEGKIRDMMDSLYDPTTHEVRDGFEKQSPNVLRVALDFLLDAREHLANWQYSLEMKSADINRNAGRSA